MVRKVAKQEHWRTGEVAFDGSHCRTREKGALGYRDTRFPSEPPIHFSHNSSFGFLTHQDSADRALVVVKSIINLPGVSSRHAEDHIDPGLFKGANDCFTDWDFF
jgi:hypothetical protein